MGYSDEEQGVVKNIGVESEEEVNEITFWYDSKLIRGEIFYALKTKV